jgi:hypothetical protein
MWCRDEGKRRHNYFVRQTHGTYGDLKCDCTVAHCDAVSNAEHLFDPSLEFPDKRPVVGEPSSVEKIIDSCKQFVTIPNVWPACVNRLWKRWRAAHDCEVMQLAFKFHGDDLIDVDGKTGVVQQNTRIVFKALPG